MAGSFGETAGGAAVTTAGSLKNGDRARSRAVNTPEPQAQAVAMSDVPTIADGLTELLAARIAMVVTGTICTELVLMARKVHMALVAVPGRGFSNSKSFMARSPSGVAALPRPSMLAAMFMIIEPIAGCAAGTSGNSQHRNRAQHPRQQCHQPAPFRQAHQAQPEGHYANQGKSRLDDRILGHLEALVGHLLQVPLPAADEDGKNNQAQPDVIEHGARLHNERRKQAKKVQCPDLMLADAPLRQVSAATNCLLILQTEITYSAPWRDW